MIIYFVGIRFTFIIFQIFGTIEKYSCLTKTCCFVKKAYIFLRISLTFSLFFFSKFMNCFLSKQQSNNKNNVLSFTIILTIDYLTTLFFTALFPLAQILYRYFFNFNSSFAWLPLPLPLVSQRTFNFSTCLPSERNKTNDYYLDLEFSADTPQTESETIFYTYFLRSSYFFLAPSVWKDLAPKTIVPMDNIVYVRLDGAIKAPAPFFVF